MLNLCGVCPSTSADCADDSDGMDVDAGCWRWTSFGDDVGVAASAAAAGDEAVIDDERFVELRRL